MILLAAILHPYGCLDECLTESCKPSHSKWNYASRSSGFLINCVAILPVIGQICGICMINAAVKDYRRSTDTFEKVESVSYLLRGIVTLLGLGILCLVFDLIISFAILLKNAVIENMNEFERFP